MSVADIIKEMLGAMKTIDEQIVDLQKAANKARGAARKNLEDEIERLQDVRTTYAAEGFELAQQSDEMAAAVATISAATVKLTKVAKRLQKVSAVVEVGATLLETATKVQDALKDPAQ